MRKVTGYIGALIVVVALMGSILAGYALNINGQSTVVNEYENVTDVSGLYSHTDQKTYIDYNPASNYIGYNLTPATFNNPITNGHYLKVTNAVIKIRYSDSHIIVNNTDVGTTTWGWEFFCDDFVVLNKTIFSSFLPQLNANTDIDINVSAGTTTLTVNNTSYTRNTTINIVEWNGEDYDYVIGAGFGAGVSSSVNVYFNNPDQIVSYGNDSTNGSLGYISVGNTLKTVNNGGIRTMSIIDTGTIVYPGVYYSNVNYNVSNNTPVVMMYPRSVDSNGGTGIDYTESNRVNNYIIGYRDIDGTPVTTSSRIDLQNVSTTNYATPNKEWIIGERMNGGDLYGNNPDWRTQFKTGPVYSDNTGTTHTGQYKVYKFTDLLTSIAPPQNTKTVSISAPQIIGQLSDGTTPIFYRTPEGSFEYTANLPYNLVAIGNYAGTYDYNMRVPQANNVNDQWFNSNIYRSASYDVESGLVSVYDSNGAKILTDSVNNIYIQFIYQPATYGYYENYNINTGVSGSGYYRTQQLPTAQLDVNITTSTSTSTPIYMDITKGIKIDPANLSDTIWTNEYENGQIQLLFRAEDTYGTYHNELTVSGNTISVDYTGGRFYVSLNGAEQIDVGAWRNILLNIDLLNGNVSVNPVRTFNSYTNVSTDKAVINIGDMVNAAPATTMVWKPTTNSFTFSVYATNVFLNTYGVVMVNPSLTITNYFTDLNNFYRLVLNNFSTYGDSITVNGVTGNVSGNTITFNDESITLKNLEIIYADGHVYVEDDNDSVDLGTIVNNDISLSGVWYFETDLDRGYTTTKQIYTWDWTDFILDNTQFCIFYIGMALVGLVVARRFCIMSVIDYAVFITSIIIALSTQVIA